MLDALIKDIFHNKEKYEAQIETCKNTVNYLKKVFEEFNKNYKQIDIANKIETFKTISNSKISYDESNTADVEFTNLFAPCLQFLYMYRPHSDQNIIGAGEYLFNALAKNTSLRSSGNKNYDLDINSLILKNNKKFSKIDIKKLNANKININKDVLTIYVGISGNKLIYNARMLN